MSARAPQDLSGYATDAELEAIAAPRFSADRYRDGRQWYSDFANAEEDAAVFDISGFDRVTDGAITALRLTASGTEGTVFPKGSPALRNVDVRIKYKLQVDGTYGTTNTQTWLLARYLGANNLWRLQKRFAAGNPTIQADSNKAGVQANTVAVTDSDITDTSTYRFLRFRVLEDTVFAKSWFSGSAEPDWQLVQRLRPPSSNISGGTTSVDNIDQGAAGVAIRYNNLYLAQVQVTELVRESDSLIFNGGLTLPLDQNSLPLFWEKPSLTTGNTLTVESTDDWEGVTRSVFQAAATVDNVGNSVLWTQHLFAADRLDITTNMARKRPQPRVMVPRVVEVSLRSRSVGAITNSGTLAAAFVMYYFDKEGNALNGGGGLGTYYNTLGPNTGGKGEWDWSETKWRFPLVNSERLTWMRVQVGMHDTASRGTVQFSDLRMRAVA